MANKEKISLMRQYEGYEAELDKLLSKKGKLTKEEDDRRRELVSLLKSTGSKLGQMDPNDGQNP